MKLEHEPTLADIRAAHARIRPLIHRTPVLTCRTVDELVGSQVFFKCENFQKVGAFKYRGACNALLSLTPAERAAAWPPTPRGTTPRRWRGPPGRWGCGPSS